MREAAAEVTPEQTPALAPATVAASSSPRALTLPDAYLLFADAFLHAFAAQVFPHCPLRRSPLLSKHTEHPERIHRQSPFLALLVVALDYELPAAAPEPNHGSMQLSGRSRRMSPVEEDSFHHTNLRQRGEQGQLGKNRLFACNRHVCVV